MNLNGDCYALIRIERKSVLHALDYLLGKIIFCCELQTFYMRVSEQPCCACSEIGFKRLTRKRHKNKSDFVFPVGKYNVEEMIDLFDVLM